MGLQRVGYDLVTEQTTAKIFGMGIILLVETIWKKIHKHFAYEFEFAARKSQIEHKKAYL